MNGISAPPLYLGRAIFLNIRKSLNIHFASFRDVCRKRALNAIRIWRLFEHATSLIVTF